MKTYHKLLVLQPFMPLLKNNMKNTFAFILIFLAINTYAQYPGGMFSKDPLLNQENFDQQRLSWGYFLGFNSFDFKFNYKENSTEILVDRSTGFNVGLIGDLRLNNYFNLRFEPGLYYTQRILNYPDQIKEIDQTREVSSTYINFPLLLKFSSVRTGNIKPFLVGGVSTSLNLSSNSESIDDNLQQKFRVKTWTQNYELGIGIDLYFEYFKFSPSVRGVFGIGNELIPDNDPNSPWTGNISSLQTRGLLVNFTFQ